MIIMYGCRGDLWFGRGVGVIECKWLLYVPPGLALNILSSARRVRCVFSWKMEWLFPYVALTD